MASLILGTAETPVWLLRSRPDQVSGDSMRGDPPSAQFIEFSENLQKTLNFAFAFLLFSSL